MYYMLPSVVLISNRPRRTPLFRHVTKIPSPQLLYFPHLQNVTPVTPLESALTKTAGWRIPRSSFSVYRSHSRAKIEFANLFFSIPYALFQVPYPVTLLFATLTKRGGCGGILPKLELYSDSIALSAPLLIPAPSLACLLSPSPSIPAAPRPRKTLPAAGSRKWKPFSSHRSPRDTPATSARSVGAPSRPHRFARPLLPAPPRYAGLAPRVPASPATSETSPACVPRSAASQTASRTARPRSGHFPSTAPSPLAPAVCCCSAAPVFASFRAPNAPAASAPAPRRHTTPLPFQVGVAVRALMRRENRRTPVLDPLTP